MGNGRLRCLAQGFCGADRAHVITADARRGDVAVWQEADIVDSRMGGTCASVSDFHELLSRFRKRTWLNSAKRRTDVNS